MSTLLDFLESRADESRLVLDHLSLFDIARLGGVSRRFHAWSKRALRLCLGNKGIVPCGTAELELDLVSMKFRKGVDRTWDCVDDSTGCLFFSGLFTQNNVGKTCRVLVHTSTTCKFTLQWDCFPFFKPPQQNKLKAQSKCCAVRQPTHPVRDVLRPLVLPAELPGENGTQKGLLILNPSGHSEHDFIAHDRLLTYIEYGWGNQYIQHCFMNVLYKVEENYAWDQRCSSRGLYQAAIYVPELQGIVYSNFDVMCFKRYHPRQGFTGPVIALPFAHSIDKVHLPEVPTLAYEPFAGTLYVIGGILSNQRKSNSVYVFALRDYIEEFHRMHNGNTVVKDDGVFPASSVQKVIYPGHKFLFQDSGISLRFERVWCAARFANQGKVLIIWGGKGKGNKHPSAVEIFYQMIPLSDPLSSPDNIIW